MKFKDSYIDPIDYQNPEKKFWTDNFMNMDPFLFKDSIVYLKKYYLVTDSGFLFEDINTQVVYQFERYFESTSLSTNEDLLKMRIYIETEVIHVFRSYLKIWNLTASVGGVFNFIHIICLI